MIERLSSDTLDDQRISPSPITPEQSDSEQNLQRPSSEELKYSPGDMRKRSQTQGKRAGATSNRHRPLTNSKSTDSIDCPDGDVHHNQKGRHYNPPPSSSSSSSSSSSHRLSSRHEHRDRRGDHHAGGSRDTTHLRPPPPSSSSFSSDSHNHVGNVHFSRTQSGSSIQSGQSRVSTSTTSTTGTGSQLPPHQHRSLSPPATMGSSSSSREGRTISPPPPTSKPPPLPSHVKRLSGSRSMQPPSRWSGTSYKSTDSASSEDSLTADIPNHKPYSLHGSEQQHQQGVRDTHSMSVGTRPNMDNSRYFRTGHVSPNGSTPVSSNNVALDKGNSVYQQQGRTTGAECPAHSLDSVVKNAYLNSGNHINSSLNSGSSGNLVVSDHQAVRKTSWQGRHMDCTNATHPLQTSVSRGQSQSIGASLSSYPWRSAHTLPNQPQKPSFQQQQQQQQLKR